MSDLASHLLPEGTYSFRVEPFLVKQPLRLAEAPRRKAGDAKKGPAALPAPVDPALTKARQEAARIQAEARMILKEAAQKATGILAEAENEAARKKQHASEEGYTEGLARGSEEGYEQGEARGQEEGLRKWAEQFARWDSILQQTVEQKKNYFADAESTVVELALGIAAKILAREVEKDPREVFEMAKRAIAKATDRSRMVIHMHPEDLEKVGEADRASFRPSEGIKEIEFLSDDKVMPGGVLVETNAGTIDARLETQLAEVAKNLLEEAAHGD